jgi:hypothetical protein
MKTNAPIPMKIFGVDCVIPTGTEVVEVEKGFSGKRLRFLAIDDESWLVKATQDQYRAVNEWVFVDKKYVSGVKGGIEPSSG